MTVDNNIFCYPVFLYACRTYGSRCIALITQFERRCYSYQNKLYSLQAYYTLRTASVFQVKQVIIFKMYL